MTLIIFDCDGVLVDSEMLYGRISAEQFTACGDTESCIARFTGLSTPSPRIAWSSRTAYLMSRRRSPPA